MPTDAVPGNERKPPSGVLELKFVLAPEQVEPVSAWLRSELAPDPHAGEDDRYLVHSLYFDSEDLRSFHREDGRDALKYRVRRYGSEQLVFVEEKRKRRGRVTKQRSQIPLAELARLSNVDPQAAWSANWFCTRVQEGALRVRCQIAYERLARIAVVNGESLRATLDRGIRCAPDPSLGFADLNGGGVHELAPVILELKYPTALPLPFKHLIRRFGLSPRPISKYRSAILACGLAVPPRAAEAG